MLCPRCGSEQVGNLCKNCGFQIFPSSPCQNRAQSQTPNTVKRIAKPPLRSPNFSEFIPYEADSLPFQERRTYFLHYADWRVLSELNIQRKKDIIVDENSIPLYNTSAIRIRDKHIVELCLTAYSLPECIGDLFFLEILRLEYFADFTLPATIGKLHNLKRLQIIEGSLKTLPEEIGELLQLEELVLNYLPIEALPSSLYSLMNLQKVEMDHSNPVIFDEKWIQSLKNKGCKFYIS